LEKKSLFSEQYSATKKGNLSGYQPGELSDFRRFITTDLFAQLKLDLPYL
jgi:hypothetical protein